MTDKARIRGEAQRFADYFAASGARMFETDILQPAETLLDLYGEDIRHRAFVTHDPIRGEMMLRPDFTVPLAQAHGAAGPGPARYTYAGEVFRKQEESSARAIEYLQVGFELFDAGAPAAADAEVFALFAEVLSPLGLRVATGDIGILLAAVRGLNTTDARKAALARHIWRPKRFRQLLDRFSGKKPAPAREALFAAHAKGGLDDLIDATAPVIGLRRRAEIVARVDRLAAEASEPPISEAEVQSLNDMLTVRESAPFALAHLRDLAVDLTGMVPALDRLEARLDAFDACDIDVSGLLFEASFGRTSMEYYDGFVFGFFADDRPDLPPVASGGRYDALTRALGLDCPAVGGVVRPGVVATLKEVAP